MTFYLSLDVLSNRTFNIRNIIKTEFWNFRRCRCVISTLLKHIQASKSSLNYLKSFALNSCAMNILVLHCFELNSICIKFGAMVCGVPTDASVHQIFQQIIRAKVAAQNDYTTCSPNGNQTWSSTNNYVRTTALLLLRCLMAIR